jgi:molybdenum cofactor cytidylyltransferase
MNSSTIGLIILAAGASTRMGTPKQLLPYQGCSFVRHITEVAIYARLRQRQERTQQHCALRAPRFHNAIASVCQPIAVVLGANAERIKPEISQLPVQIVENQQWAEGMSSSIRVGLEALLGVNQNLEAVAIALCDQPFVSSQTINQLIEAYHLTGKPIIASEYAGTLGVPVLFSHTLFSELIALKSNEGAKQIIKKHIHEVFSVPFPDGAIDIDTPNDYEKLQTLMKSTQR